MWQVCGRSEIVHVLFLGVTLVKGIWNTQELMELYSYQFYINCLGMGGSIVDSCGSGWGQEMSSETEWLSDLQ